MFASLLPVAAGEHNLLLPHSYDLVYGTIVFIIIAVPFAVFILPKFNRVMDERGETIAKGLEDAKSAEQNLANAQAKAQVIMDGAYSEANQIREEAHEQARKIIENARHEASTQAARISELAQTQIETERLAAQKALESQIGLTATKLAEKIVGEHLLDPQITSRVVDRFLDDLTAEMSTSA